MGAAPKVSAKKAAKKAARKAAAVPPPPPMTVADAANDLASNQDADVMLINAAAAGPMHILVHLALQKRSAFRPKLYLILVSEGGSADIAYRAMRMLQERYPEIIVVVPGWCKSAGTLMCIGANRILMGPLGEMGPLDVQLVRPDQLNERSSGLAIDTAVEKLQHEAFKLFVGFIREMADSEFRFSLRTASDVAQNVAVGLLSPIFQKLDPISIGEDFRSYKIAQAYAERLNLKGQNLKINQEVDGLAVLLGAYPSHGFVIDLKEAKSIFAKVLKMGAKTTKIVELLGTDALFPLDRERDQARVDFLSDEPPAIPPTSGAAAQAAAKAVAKKAAGRRGKAGGAKGP